MAFIESPRFPDAIAFGAAGGPSFNTEVVQTISGAEQRNANWAYPLHDWDVSQGIKTTVDFTALRAFFMSMRGRLHAWRFKDWADYSCAATDGVLSGSGGSTAQLVKRYSIATQWLDRKISKPVSGTVVVSSSGTPLVAGADYTLDTTTGLVTWSANGSAAVTGVTVGATTQVTLASALSALGAGDKLNLASLGGTDAALLTAAPCLINAVAGAVYTLAVNTAGKTITPAGTGKTYPGSRAADVLAWSGEFDVPMRFDVDKLTAQIRDRNAADGLLHLWDGIKIVEIRL